MSVFVIGRTEVGVVAEDRDPRYTSGGVLRYYLTDCCGASAKGCDGYVGCRSCYAEVDPGLGGLPEWDPLVEVYGDGLAYDEWKATRR